MSTIEANRVYEHFKGGRYYVLGIADDSTNTRTARKVVVYVSLTYGKLKARDLEEFTELVEWPDGEKRPRFIPVE